MRRGKFNVYRDGKMHVCERMCGTCIYHKDSPLMDSPIKREAVELNTAVVCHSTLDKRDKAVCKGFYDNDMTPTLALARAMGVVEFVKVP